MKIKNKFKCKLIILGSGPAGYTAAIYAARANLNPVLITGLEKGGQLMNTNEVENWPGKIKISGYDLMQLMDKHAINFNTKMIEDHISEVQLKQKPFLLIGEKNEYSCDALIIATGSSARTLDIENTFHGKGISYCATCDGYFYLNKKIAVVGGGNSALEEALYLSNIASEVNLIHRKNNFKADKILIDRVLKKVKLGKIILHKNYIIKKIEGNNDTGLNNIIINNVINQKIKEIEITGLFVAIGHTPNTNIFKNEIFLDKNGYIKTKNIILKGFTTMTNIPGIFVAGDVMDSIYRQAITSAATGCMAALDAEQYLNNINNIS